MVNWHAWFGFGLRVIAIAVYFKSLTVSALPADAKWTSCASDAIRNAETQNCELPVLAKCVSVKTINSNESSDDAINCVANAHCKLTPGETVRKCSCLRGFVASDNNTACKRNNNVWTEMLIPKNSLLLHRAREPRHRYIHNTGSNSSGYLLMMEDNAPSLQLSNVYIVGLALLMLLQEQTVSLAINLSTMFSLLLRHHRFWSKFSKMFLPYLCLALLAPARTIASNLSVEYEEDEYEPKCPYSTIFNSDTGECNSKLGDPCQVNYNKCGLNTECLDSKCTCKNDFWRAFNNMDCWPSEEFSRDVRYRLELRRSWRLKDNPENREIECKKNPHFSPKCAELDAKPRENSANQLILHFTPVQTFQIIFPLIVTTLRETH